MPDIVFVNTVYQLEVFLDVCRQEHIQDWIALAPEKIRDFVVKNNLNLDSFYFISDVRRRESFEDARRRLSEINSFCEKYKNIPVRFFLANDDQVAAQVVYRKLRVVEVNLFEEGLGSYSRHGFMFYNLGLIHMFSRLKKLLYYFPYYAAFYSYGGNIKADKCYSYHLGAFPLQKRANKILIKKLFIESSLEANISADSVFLGQPLVEQGMLNVDEYRSALIKIKEHINEDREIIYKPHPLEVIEGKLPKGYRLLDTKESAESLIFSAAVKNVFGFYSTALANATLMEAVVTVVAFRLDRLKQFGDAYDVLQNTGCQVVCLDA